MKDLFSKILFHVKVRIPAIAVCVLLFLTFGLYYLGLFEISFIKRPEAWKDNPSKFYEAINTIMGKDESDEGFSDETTSPTEDSTNAPDDTDGGKVPNKRPTGEDGPISADKMTSTTVLPTLSELAAEGYKTTDTFFGEGSRFALLETSYALPKKFSFTKKTYDKQVSVYYDDGRPAEVEIKSITEDRPAIELYMGYIIFDDAGTRYLVAPNGTPLSKYNEKFLPAFTRDKEGRPLFYQTYKEKVKYPTEVGEPDEEGNTPWISEAEVEIERKKYYYLDTNGVTFRESDYNDASDNRGLYFDYPAYYGVPTKEDTKNELTRYYKETTKVVTRTDKNKKITDVFAELKWLFKQINDDTFDPDSEETLYPYTSAYNYSEGYAVVKSDISWFYNFEDLDGDGEKDNVEMKDSELYVINEEGKRMFETRKNFLSDLGWNANEYYCEPLLRDISSIGSYYFDHGLLRIRLVSYDPYQLVKYDVFKVGTDDDLLVHPDGSRFYIPSGYKLEAYSDGMILLSRDGKYGYMDYTGKWVVDMGLKSAAPFVEGVAAVQRANGKFGMIDTAGNTVIPFRYDYISNASSGLVAAYSEDSGWEIYTKMAK